MKRVATVALFFMMCVPTLVSAETVLITQASKNGVVRCMPKLKELTSYLGLNDIDYNVFCSYFTNDTNNRMYIDTIVKEYNDGSTSLAIVSAAPYAGGCDASLQQVFTSDSSCIQMRESVLKGWKYVENIKNVTKLESAQGGSYFYLTSVGSGCVAVKVE